jgi:Tol biopolymer transport system component/DNA-binding winged helix-turn-helix (wHTH) protein
MGTPTNTAATWRFGVFEFDARSGELRRAGVPIKLREQSLRILVYLLEQAGRMVTREELRQHLWPSGTFVDFDHSLNTAVMKLREVLGDSADKPLYIETVPKRGYRFIAPVSMALATESPSYPATNQQPAVGDSEETLARTNGAEAISHESAGNTTHHWPLFGTDAILGGVSAGKVPGKRGPSPKWLLSGLVAVALITLVVGFLAIRAIKNRGGPVRLAQPFDRRAASGGMRIVPLTNVSGSIWDPAFSPDVEKIAFIWDGENPVRGDLYTQLIGGEKPLRLTHTNSGFICCANWSPDGREIAFGRCYDNGAGVFVIPALGGSERKLTDVVCNDKEAGDPQWTADGKSLVIADRCDSGDASGIVLFSLATGEKRCLHSPPRGESGDMLPTLSPDGKDVAFIRELTRGQSDIYLVGLAGGKLRQLTSEGKSIWHLIWATDGQHILFDSARSGLTRVWRISRAGGTIEPETVFPEVGTLSRDGRRLAYVQPSEFWRLSCQAWRAELSSAGGPVVSLRTSLTSAGFDGGLQPSPDGRQIIFQSMRSGRPEIWKSSADGNDPIQMTFLNTHAGTPRWSPDNHWITFDSRSERHGQIYLIDAEGRNLHRITSGDYENIVPSWSRDGASIYFSSNRTGERQVWKRDLATGQEKQITRHGGFAALESYDGKALYYSRFEGGGIWRVPVDGGSEDRITEALHRGYWGHFAVSEAGLYLLDVDVNPSPTILYYNFQTRQLTPVLRLQQSPIPWTANLGASRDGRTLLFAEGESKSSITMVENFQ